MKIIRERKLNFDNQHETLEPEDDLVKGTSIFNHLASKIFIFVIVVISLIVALIVIMLLFKGEKMQALVTNLAMLKGVKAQTEGTKIGTNYEYWIIIAWLSLILLGVMFFIIEKVHKMPILGKYQYCNTIKIMIFILNIKSYVPIKSCKTSGSIHLFKLMGSLQREDESLHRNNVWDILDIHWRNVRAMVNGNIINLPGSMIIPFRDKFKVKHPSRTSKEILLYLTIFWK